MAYSSGKYAYGICDKTGFRYPLKDLVFEFRNGSKTGFRVGIDVLDEDHPQNFVGRIKFQDDETILDARIDRVEPAAEVLSNPDPFTSGTASSGSTEITVKEVNHGRSTSDTVRFRNVTGSPGGLAYTVFENASGFSISSVTTNTYVFDCGSNATVTEKAGGTFVTAGPVTQLA